MSRLARQHAREASAKFHLDRDGGKFLGVCAGLAWHLGMDVIIIRLIFAIGTLIGFGSFTLIYFAIALLAD